MPIHTVGQACYIMLQAYFVTFRALGEIDTSNQQAGDTRRRNGRRDGIAAGIR